MPERSSARRELRDDSRRLASLKAPLTFRRNTTETKANRGVTAMATRASPGFMRKSIRAVPKRSSTSLNMFTSTAANISFNASMSLVTRVTSLPTALRSKNERERFCMWEKSADRRSYIDLCPAISRVTAWP